MTDKLHLEETDTLSIRVTVECEPGVTRERAERIAYLIARYAERRPGVDHAYEQDVYSLDDLEIDE